MYAKLTSSKVLLSDAFLKSARTPRTNLVRELIPNLASFGINVEYKKNSAMLGSYIRLPLLRIISFLGKRGKFNFFDSGSNYVHLSSFAKSRISFGLGYFQSFNFPDFIKVNLPQLFTIPQLEFSEFSQQHNFDENVILIHIRGGDYLDSINADFGILNGDYFQRAIKRLNAEDGGNRIWVITNDRQHCDNVLRETSIQAEMILDENLGLSELEVLAIMACASKIVISNSTFSWWGAFFASINRSPQIIAPVPWFRNLSENSENRIPPEWKTEQSTWKV